MAPFLCEDLDCIPIIFPALVQPNTDPSWDHNRPNPNLISVQALPLNWSLLSKICEEKWGRRRNVHTLLVKNIFWSSHCHIYKNTHTKSRQTQERSKSKSITVIPKEMPEMLQLMPFNHLSIIHFCFPQPSYEEMKPWFFISNLTDQMECCTNPWDLRELRLEILAVLLPCTVLLFFISTAATQINPLVCMNMDWFKKKKQLFTAISLALL